MLSEVVYIDANICEWEEGGGGRMSAAPTRSLIHQPSNVSLHLLGQLLNPYGHTSLHGWSHLILLTVTAGGRAWSNGVGRREGHWLDHGPARCHAMDSHKHQWTPISSHGHRCRDTDTQGQGGQRWWTTNTPEQLPKLTSTSTRLSLRQWRVVAKPPD